MKDLFRLLLWIQAVYYAVTALWALIDIQSFMWVSGYKTDIWLVKTVAVLLLAISASFFCELMMVSGNSRPVMVLAMACCIALAGIDLYYAGRKVISPVYLLDAVLQLVFLAVWIGIIVKKQKTDGL